MGGHLGIYDGHGQTEGQCKGTYCPFFSWGSPLLPLDTRHCWLSGLWAQTHRPRAPLLGTGLGWSHSTSDSEPQLADSRCGTSHPSYLSQGFLPSIDLSLCVYLASSYCSGVLCFFFFPGQPSLMQKPNFHFYDLSLKCLPTGLFLYLKTKFILIQIQSLLILQRTCPSVYVT